MGHRGLMVMELDSVAKDPGLKSHPRILFLGEFLKKKQRNKIFRRILLIEENENKDKWMGIGNQTCGGAI